MANFSPGRCGKLVSETSRQLVRCETDIIRRVGSSVANLTRRPGQSCHGSLTFNRWGLTRYTADKPCGRDFGIATGCRRFSEVTTQVTDCHKIETTLPDITSLQPGELELGWSLAQEDNFPINATGPVIDPPSGYELEPPNLTMRLTSLNGTSRDFQILQDELAALESGDARSSFPRILSQVHEILSKESGGKLRPDLFGKWVEAYILETSDAPKSILDALAVLDAYLISMRGFLIEDLTPPILERFSQDFLLFSDVAQSEKIRMDVYGTSRFPVPVAECSSQNAAGIASSKISGRRRQFIIERETQRAAIREYLEQREELTRQGHTTGTRSGQFQEFVQGVAKRVQSLREGSDVATGRGSNASKLISKHISLGSETLGVITCATVMNLLLCASYRRKSEMKAAVAAGKLDIPYVTAVVAVGEAVLLENAYADLVSKKTKKPQPTHKSIAAARHRAAKDIDTTRAVVVPIGAALVDLMLQTATVKLKTALLSTQDKNEVASLLKTPVDSLEATVRIPCLTHAVKRERKTRQVGYLILPSVVRANLDVNMDELATFVEAKHQPMVIEPRPWKPSAAPTPEGAYLMHKVAFIRTSNPGLTHLRLYSPGNVADVMDSCGLVPWKINRWIWETMNECKRRDMAIASVPPRINPEIPSVEGYDYDQLSPEEQKQVKIRRRNATMRCQMLQSERPTFELKLRVARDFMHAPRIYFPHNVDFRGRAYPLPPHLNHIGNDVCRGLLEFADKKPLGEKGWYWLRVNLANLLGRNKIPFDERVKVVDDLKDRILSVVDDPLSDENVEFWANADDGPWQALANCREIASAWRSGDPTNFRSSMPVHMDGSCNGLQHYAALGLDENGGRAVNLLPSDSPQDVYMLVLKKVKEKVEATSVRQVSENELDAMETGSITMTTVDMAKRVLELNVLQRKVVKQTVMTICYGVTTLGAKQQVQGQLQDMVGDTLEQKELSDLAKFISKTVLSSIDEVFQQAMEIKRWFDQASQAMNKLERPTSWVSPAGLACVQPYKKVIKIAVSTKRQSVTLATQDGPKVHKMKQKMGFPPNFVHSLDASHMMMVAKRCKAEGLFFAGVHDSFWTHAADVDHMGSIIRRSFVDLHSMPLLIDLEEDMRLQLGSTGVELPALPGRGCLDIEKVIQSKYFFH